MEGRRRREKKEGWRRVSVKKWEGVGGVWGMGGLDFTALHSGPSSGYCDPHGVGNSAGARDDARAAAPAAPLYKVESMDFSAVHPPHSGGYCGPDVVVKTAGARAVAQGAS